MRKIAPALFAAALLVGGAMIATAPAAAQAQPEDVTVEVPVEGLNLARPADQERLDNRVEQAVRRACRNGGLDLASRRQEAACRRSLSDAFAPQIELAIAEARTTHLAAIIANPGA